LPPVAHATRNKLESRAKHFIFIVFIPVVFNSMNSREFIGLSQIILLIDK